MTGNTHPHRSRRTKTVRLTDDEIALLRGALRAAYHDEITFIGTATEVESIYQKLGYILISEPSSDKVTCPKT